LLVVWIACDLVGYARQQRKFREAKKLADLWRSLRIMEGAATREQSSWTRAEVARIKVDLEERGERP